MSNAQANNDYPETDRAPAAGQARDVGYNELTATEIDSLLDQGIDHDSMRTMGGIARGIALGAAIWAALIAAIWLLV
jgi:hypothetical protein